ncbi:MAG: neutral ceramidase [Myxococcota bacterium]|jgi:neutral ceramidase
MWVIALALIGCSTPEAQYEAPPVLEGAPVAGAAEGTLDLPVGTPLGGYSSRCGCLSGQSRQDGRDSNYTTAFVESTGIHTRAGIKVVWLENGDESFVLAHVDVIYSNDNLVTYIANALSEQTGEDLTGRVVLSTNHSHHSYGPFSDQGHFYLGGDVYNPEIFHRFVSDVVGVAMDAYDTREPVAIGTSWTTDWDPDDRIYRDRRGVNNTLQVWEDGPEVNGKDPNLNMLRIDRVDGSPMAAVFTFGIHGISVFDQNSLVSTDAPGAIEIAFQEQWDEPVVVMHLQGAGGDASPAGRDSGYARPENLGEQAAPILYEVWERTPTSSDDIRIETSSRHIWQYPTDIRVTRDGTMDLRYAPLVDLDDADPDNIVYAEDGSILSPLDEFNAPNGAAFCGEGTINLPTGVAGSLGAGVAPYDSCVEVGFMAGVVGLLMGLEANTLEAPFKESLKAGTTVSRFGPIPTLLPDGTEQSLDVFGGFFPGEVTAMYAEQWRRRSAAELGHPYAWAVGYSQDHEGYLLIPEDWLMGGYEPSIALWGPLQGEHIMEGMLDYGDEVLNTNVREDSDPWGWYGPTEYVDKPLPELQVDMTPNAGTRLTELPEYYWTPPEILASLDTPDQVERLTGIVQLAWEGGDPTVDLPEIVLERLDGETWAPVRSRSGRKITDTFGDILTGHTPFPLSPVTDEQVHYWWAGWQVAAHDGYRAGLPLGTYRLVANGKRYTGGATTWPWPTADYTVEGDAFEVVPAVIRTEDTADGFWAWFDAPVNGYRSLDVDGSSQGRNPVRRVTLSAPPPTDVDGPIEVTLEPVEIAGGRARFVVDVPSGAQLADPAGNVGDFDR